MTMRFETVLEGLLHLFLESDGMLLRELDKLNFVICKMLYHNSYF